MIDYRWMSSGGLLMDGTGDIDTYNTPLESTVDMVRTRIKASLNAWQLYSLGADLQNFIGNVSDSELEVQIQRQVLSSLSRGYLPTNVFNVVTTRLGNTITVFVYIQKQLVATAIITRTPNTPANLAVI